MTQVPITWWGHATTTIELGGLRVLTDPVLVSRLAHLRRLGGPAPGLAARQADIVLISHLHADHLHLPSLRLLDARTTVLAPRGTASVLRRHGGLAARLVEIDPGSVYDASRHGGSGLSIQAVPAHHPHQRLPGSRHRAPAVGYVLRDGDMAVWFAGDTGLFASMGEIGPVDVALVPVGGWGPTLGPEHMDPAQAAEAVRRVGAAAAVPIHFGTFWPVGLRAAQPGSFRRMFVEPGAQFGAALALAEPLSRSHLLAAGRRSLVGAVRTGGPGDARAGEADGAQDEGGTRSPGGLWLP